MAFTLKNLKFIYILIIFHSITSHPQRSKRKERVSNRIDYSGSQVIRFNPQTPEQLEYLISLENDPRVNTWLEPTKVGQPADFMVHFKSAREMEKVLERLGMQAEVLIDDVGEKMRSDEIQTFSSMNSFFGNYRRYSEIRNFLYQKFSQNAGLTSLIKIGKSLEGRPILCIKIGEDLHSRYKPIIYIDGGMHAREWVAISTALFIIENLIEDYKQGDPQVRYLMQIYDFYIVPVVNPDGYEYTHTTDRMWRKNKAKIPGSNCIGVDLNRNYPFHWGGEGSSRDPCDETYCGPSALSEPESKAVTELILENKERMKAYITLHSYGQYFLYPWGYSRSDSPNMIELKRVADIGYAALNSVHGTVYSVGTPGQIMYPAQGSDDWAHGGAKIPYVYTLEMRDRGRYGFIAPKSEIIPVGEETYAGVKAIAGAIVNTKCWSNICQKIF